jgi:hypothetical protein
MPPQTHLDRRRRMLIPASLTALLVTLVMAAPAWSAGPTADPAATAAPATVTRPLPGPPTWPVHPQPITAAPDSTVVPAPARPLPGPPTWPVHPQPVTAAPDSTVVPAPARPLPGPPTWPAHPQPITAAPAADDGNGVSWTTLGLTITGGLLVVSGIVALTYRRSRRPQRVRATA